MSISTVFSQNSQDSTRSENPVEDIKAYKYKVKNVDYVMFKAEDYRELLRLGREYAINLNIQDSLIIKHNKLEKSINMYIAVVDNFQELNTQQELEIVDLNKNFAEYSYATEKKLAKLILQNGKLKKAVWITSAIVLIETVIMILSFK